MKSNTSLNKPVTSSSKTATNGSSVLKAKSSINVTKNSTIAPITTKTTSVRTPVSVSCFPSSRRAPSANNKLTKSLSRSHDSLQSPNPPSVRQKFNLPSKPRPQSALGLHNSGLDAKDRVQRKLIMKLGNNGTNNSSIRRSPSKESIDSNNSKEREKENLVKNANNRKSASVIVQLDKEKKILEQRISELVRNAESKKTEIATLKMEMKSLTDESKHAKSTELQNLNYENNLLKDRLIQFGFSLDQPALSDNEKEMLLNKVKTSRSLQNLTGDDSKVMNKSADLLQQHSLSPVNTSMQSSNKCNDYVDIDDLGEGAGCSYEPSCDRVDWDKQSSSSISEMSVACLQDRIMQMEETHYSTNEELQATLQELSDLQDQLTDLQIDNEQLKDEKSVMLESLCSQTEKLEECRSQISSLKQLLFQQSSDDASGKLSASEREEKLVELLKCSEIERELLIAKHDELMNAVHNTKEEGSESKKELASFIDRNKLLESTIESTNTDKRLLEKQLHEMKEQVDNDQIEILRISTLLENERQRVHEMKEAREAVGKSELDRLVDAARKEKDKAECRANELQDQVVIAQCEVTRLKEQLSILQEQTMVSNNNAKKRISDLEYKIEQIEEEKCQCHRTCQLLEANVNELETKCQRHLGDKRELKMTVSDLHKNLADISDELNETRQISDEVKKKHFNDIEEWNQFKNDLLMTVRVANDFRTEAQVDLDRLLDENETFKKKITSLNSEIERLKVTQTNQSSEVLSTVERDLTARRQTVGGKRNVTNQLSVKNLIESIESATKQAKAQGPHSRSSSSSSLSSCTSETKLSPTTQPILRRSENDVYIKPPLRPVSCDSAYIKEQKMSPCGVTSPSSATKSVKSARHSYAEGIVTRSLVTASGKENAIYRQNNKVNSETHQSTELSSKPVVSILAGKLDPIRRNSYSDIGDKKDPLATLAKNGGSKRNALLKWCQNKVVGYKGVDVTNFSSSWNDGLAFCALLHSYNPDRIPYKELDSRDKKKNFTLAFQAAESVGIPTTLNINDMISIERPDWQSIMGYVTNIYKHFET